MRRIDGTEFDGLFTVSFPPEGVATSKFLIAVIDISERVNAQAALRNLQAELGHAARLSTLGELAASIAHEVNQPLAAITTDHPQACNLAESLISAAIDLPVKECCEHGDQPRCCFRPLPLL